MFFNCGRLCGNTCPSVQMAKEYLPIHIGNKPATVHPQTSLCHLPTLCDTCHVSQFSVVYKCRHNDKMSREDCISKVSLPSTSPHDAHG